MLPAPTLGLHEVSGMDGPQSTWGPSFETEKALKLCLVIGKYEALPAGLLIARGCGHGWLCLARAWEEKAETGVGLRGPGRKPWG